MLNKPIMYHGDYKEFNNNQTYASSRACSSNPQVIRDKIKKILTSNNFFYLTKVNIVKNNTTITKKIMGMDKDNLVTIDNELIPINTITDIYKV